jgi:hypothetical protein
MPTTKKPADSGETPAPEPAAPLATGAVADR